jgi:hypothetical protein
MPSSYRLGHYGPQLWTALVFAPEIVLPEARENRSLNVLARLKSGVSVETAKAELAALAQRSEQAYPGTSKGWGASAIPLQQYIADEFRVAMRMLMGAVIFVLLIACANIASLQLPCNPARESSQAHGRARVVFAWSANCSLRVFLALAGGGRDWFCLLGCFDRFQRSDRLCAPDGARGHDHTVLAYTLGISILQQFLRLGAGSFTRRP